MTISTLPMRSAPRALTPRLARVHINALASDSDSPPRAVVVGIAGSGKSDALRRLRTDLTDRGLNVALVRPGIDLVEVPFADVVLVDDAHLLDDPALTLLTRRADDPEVGLVLACRPWPQSDALRRLARQLEASRPTIVLGNLSAADAFAHEVGATSSACVEDLLERCGNAAWLMSNALAVHDDGCRAPSDHDLVAHALYEVIAHRVHTVSPQLSAAVELISVSAVGTIPASIDDDILASGHAEGLLQRNGQPAPIVRAAVRATMSVQRIVELCDSDEIEDESRAELLGDVRDPRIASALLARAGATVDADPARAEALYRRALDCGADRDSALLGLARAAWAIGRLDAAATHLDALLAASTPRHDEAAALSAAVWAARGFMTHAHATFRAITAGDPVRDAQAFVAATAAANPETDGEPRTGGDRSSTARAVPSTLTVSAELLAQGLRSTLTKQHDGALNDLVRAAETYSASGSTAPVPELPGVIAALAAVHLGELDVAAGVLDTALRRDHGGAWARPRLRLWRAWIDLQLQRPREVETALAAVEAAGPVSPRERLLADALLVGLARRYADSELAEAWRATHGSILRTQFDLFSLLPLAEFAVCAARVRDDARLHGHVERALADIERLGSPPVWSPHLHWAGIQGGILLNSPESLRPHARRLVAAAAHSPVAARMARAGRVWTDVLAGDVDPDAVEDSALGLADVGLAWDGARLAGHGAGRSEDRRTISRLLACARQLHPSQAARADDSSPDRVDTPAVGRPAATLSAREHEVAQLVVQGLTYAEIGETIFISARTAEHHIARIRRRLGATSRSDLIAKLRAAIDGGVTDSPARPDVHTEMPTRRSHR